MTKNETVLLRVDVPPDFRQRIKALAARLGKTMPAMVQELVMSSKSLDEWEKEIYGNAKK